MLGIERCNCSQNAFAIPKAIVFFLNKSDLFVEFINSKINPPIKIKEISKRQ
jgi:hypothetical protein